MENNSTATDLVNKNILTQQEASSREANMNSTNSPGERRHVTTNKKRFLPPRKFGPLAEALDITTEETNAATRTLFSGVDIVLISPEEQELHDCELIEEDKTSEEEGEGEAKSFENENQIQNKEPLNASFALFTEDLESGLRSKSQEEEIFSAKYEKQHRKHELAEKKLKNRELERLTYERYQQKLAVEKLRNMEMNRLIPVAALRSDKESSSINANGLELMHKKLLREAEDTLKRYDELGLGLGKKRKAEMTTTSGETSESDNRKYGVDTKKPRRKRGDSVSSSENANSVISSHDSAGFSAYSNSDNQEKPVISVTPFAAKHNEDYYTDNKATEGSLKRKMKVKISSKGAKKEDPNRAIEFSNKNQRLYKDNSTTINDSLNNTPNNFYGRHSGIKTFIRLNISRPTGYRKSSRSALVFGVKIPPILTKKKIFELPQDEYGDLIKEREDYRLTNPFILPTEENETKGLALPSASK